MTDGIFGVKKKGEDGFYMPERDILHVTPAVLVKGAVFAADPNTWVHDWLVTEMGTVKVESKIRDHVDYLLDILDGCRNNPLDELFDEKRVDVNVYNAIMMGVGTMLFRVFNRLFREARFTDKKTGGITEPNRMVDKAEGLRMFDRLLTEATGS